MGKKLWKRDDSSVCALTCSDRNGIATSRTRQVTTTCSDDVWAQMAEYDESAIVLGGGTRRIVFDGEDGTREMYALWRKWDHVCLHYW